jgi:anti-sigma B factor antagonist
MAETQNSFEFEWHGDTLVIVPSRDVESLRWDLIEQAAEVVMIPLRKAEAPMVVFDLSHVPHFGSVFLSLLLRCHKHARSKGGELVICGAGESARELLRITALDTLWALYDTRAEALDAVSI